MRFETQQLLFQMSLTLPSSRYWIINHVYVKIREIKEGKAAARPQFTQQD